MVDRSELPVFISLLRSITKFTRTVPWHIQQCFLADLQCQNLLLFGRLHLVTPPRTEPCSAFLPHKQYALDACFAAFGRAANVLSCANKALEPSLIGEAVRPCVQGN